MVFWPHINGRIKADLDTEIKSKYYIPPLTVKKLGLYKKYLLVDKAFFFEKLWEMDLTVYNQFY